MKRFLASALFMAASALAQADAAALADPTRPPPAFAGEVSAAEGSGTSRLTSVILPKGGRPMAVIGGEMVPLGGRVGESRLVRLSETEAVLEGPGGIERLFLTPDVEKKMNVTKAAKRRTKE